MKSLDYLTKHEARQIYKKRRSMLSNSSYMSLSNAVTNIFLSHFHIDNNTSIHTFISSKDKREPDTLQIIKYAIQQKATIYVPYIESIDLSITSRGNTKEQTRLELHRPYTIHKPMRTAVLEPNTTLVPGEHDILQPQKPTLVTPDKIELIIVPLLAYDITGYRVGYGKGYYDRYLALYTDSTIVGLSLFPPIQLITNIESTDIKMDYCISPSNIHSF